MVLGKVVGSGVLLLGIFMLVFLSISLRYSPQGFARSGIIISILLIALGIFLMQL